MGNFYLVVETTGIDPDKDKIIAIQFLEIDRNASAKKGELCVLKEWDSRERDISLQFIAEWKMADPYLFAFVPVGYNLNFVHRFVLRHCKANGLPPIWILDKPFIDLRPFGIVMDGEEFKGSGIDKIACKPHDSSTVPRWYAEKKYAEIENYVRKDADEFIGVCSWLYKELRGLLAKFKSEDSVR